MSNPHHEHHHNSISFRGSSNHTLRRDWNVLNNIHYQKQSNPIAKIAWVISASVSGIDKYVNEISAINCYGALNNIPIFIEPLVFSKASNRDYFQDRLNNVFKYLPHYEWLFVTDADIIVANYSKSLFEYVDINDDSIDIILQFRDNIHEVWAGNYFIRNSPNGFDFLRRWLNISLNQKEGTIGLNSDNGDLLEILGQYKSNDFTTRPCVQYRYSDWEWLTYKLKFINCTLGEWDSLAIATWDRNKYAVTYGHIKIYREYLGFARTFRYMTEDGSTACLMEDINCRVLRGDFILHGKELQNYLSVDYIACSANKSNPLNFEIHSITFEGFTGLLSIPVEFWANDITAKYLSESIAKKPLLPCISWNTTSFSSCTINAELNMSTLIGFHTAGLVTAPDGSHYWIDRGFKRPMSEQVFQFLNCSLPYLESHGNDEWSFLPTGDPMDERLKNDSLYVFHSSYHQSKRVYWFIDGYRRPVKNGDVSSKLYTI